MKLITLTHAMSGSKMTVSVDHIVVMTSHSMLKTLKADNLVKGMQTEVVMSTNQAYQVKDTIAEIFEQIGKAQ